MPTSTINGLKKLEDSVLYELRKFNLIKRDNCSIYKSLFFFFVLFTSFCFDTE